MGEGENVGLETRSKNTAASSASTTIGGIEKRYRVAPLEALHRLHSGSCTKAGASKTGRKTSFEQQALDSGCFGVGHGKHAQVVHVGLHERSADGQ